VTVVGDPRDARIALLRRGDRRALARAITLIESTRGADRAEAEALLTRIAAEGAPQATLRIGMSGVPGVGKSTFVERFGLAAIARGHRVAVLAVDPSSKRTGGAILGDKTRMAGLARAPEAFVRPTAAGATLGGVARRTGEAIELVEAAGFDLVLVETVGVGQSETAVASLTDLFILLLPPAGGDELQGIKKGVVEIADILLVNKADGDLAAAAARAVADYTAAINLLRPRVAWWRPPVLPVSAATGAGVDAVFEEIARWRQTAEAAGARLARRREQARERLWDELTAGLVARFADDPANAARLEAALAEVAAGTASPAVAARRLLDGIGANLR
jgi:LAO/AO transport system kinase